MAMFQRITNEHQDKTHDGETSLRDETDRAPAGLPDDGVLNVPVHALVVGHGAYMSIAMRYFFEDVKCPMPRGLDAAQQYSICPNTGMCRFIITLKCSNADLALSDLKCVFINRRDHIKSQVKSNSLKNEMVKCKKATKCLLVLCKKSFKHFTPISHTEFSYEFNL